MSSSQDAAAVAIALAVLSGCCVLGRFFSRVFVVKHVGAADYLIAGAWMAAVAMAVVARRPKPDFDEDHESPDTMLLRESWSANVTYNLAVLLLKDSLLFQFLRFSNDMGYRRGCWTIGTVVTAYGVSALFVGIFACQPVAFAWDHQIRDGKCIDFLAFWLFNAAFNSITDIIVLILPLPVLRALQLPRRQGWILIGIFVLGVFVCIASIIRLVGVCTTTIRRESSASIELWSAVEINVGIICACVPSFRHPINQVMPRIMAAHQRHSYASPPLTPMSIDLKDQKDLRSTVQAFSRQGSLRSEASSVNPSAIIDLYSQGGANKSTENLSHDPSSLSHDPSIPPVLQAGVSLASHPTITTVSDGSGSMATAEETPLSHGQPPAFPAPVARPGGPRAQRPIKLHTSKSHRHGREPRYIEPLACIPESQSQTSTPDPERAFRAGNLNTITHISSPPPSRLAAPMSPSVYSTITMSSTSSSPRLPPPSASSPPSPSLSAPSPTLHNTSFDPAPAHHPWASTSSSSSTCPLVATARTYTYQILGGPRALSDSPSEKNKKQKKTPTTKSSASASVSGPRSSTDSPSPMSKRERIRREKERERRKERDLELQAERAQAQRPLGPREMRRAVSWEMKEEDV